MIYLKEVTSVATDRVYRIRAKAFGASPHVLIEDSAGQLAWIVRGRWFVVFGQKYDVLNSAGTKILSAKQEHRVAEVFYSIRRGERLIGSAGVSVTSSSGFIEMGRSPRAKISFGWGMKRSLTLSDKAGPWAKVDKRMSGWDVTLLKEDEPIVLLTGMAIIFAEFRTRG